ncbi:hypothetical protein G7067_04415 [Leucobacter insecticola]|uniref:SD-repeat containing protein B domain-containing protein n=1 Tax=Leucobacter insecticola TaxID=2714934 RepID=A0A6G8FHJ1_9MICO|nr:hypothetical protein [Leucobacter insecticola]QIM15827.1 hypothetical protein G7067_04415 [Leucobacter insecticola]
MAATVVIDSPSDGSVVSYEGNTQASATAKAQDKTYLPQLVTAGAAVFKNQKIASTATPGYVGPGEEMAYTISFANASIKNFTSAQFVDVLPFDGDNRGSTGFGGSKVELKSVSASMAAPSVAPVTIEYTTDPAVQVQTAVATAGNENAATGVSWTATAPANLKTVTALRFTVEGGMPIGASGSALVKVSAPSLALDGKVNNTISSWLIAETGGDLKSSAASSSPLKSSAVNISGKVYRDLNFDGSVSAGDSTWPATTAGLELVAPDGTVVTTTDIAADGTYQFPLVGADTYQVRLKTPTGWKKLAGSIVTEPGQTYQSPATDVLYQEEVADPILVDKTAAAGMTASTPVLIDVAAGDTLAYPVTAGSIAMAGTTAANTIAVESQPTHGTAQVQLATSGLSKIQYTAPATWPAEYADQASFVDSFTYSWTNVLGVKKTATVEVTVYKPITVTFATPEAASKTIGEKATATYTPTLTTDSGLKSATVTTAPERGRWR